MRLLCYRYQLSYRLREASTLLTIPPIHCEHSVSKFRVALYPAMPKEADVTVGSRDPLAMV